MYPPKKKKERKKNLNRTLFLKHKEEVKIKTQFKTVLNGNATNMGFGFFKTTKTFCIGVQLINNVVIVSGGL